MISKALYAIETSLKYIKSHPQIQLALILIILLPIAFLYTGNAFLEAGKSNQDKLQRDRVGILHDSFVSIVRGTAVNIENVQSEIEIIAESNPDITKLRVVTQVGNDFMILASLDDSVIGQSETEPSLYQTSAVRFDESLIFPFHQDQTRYWQAVRSFEVDGRNYFILTETSFAQVDDYLYDREKVAYMTLALVYLLVLLIAYWHIRTTDYQHLYKEAAEAIKTKDLFTNMIAHELRAPLTAIRGYASMMSESKTLNPEHQKYADRVEGSAERLLAIVNDLLDVARIQSGKLKVELVPTKLTPVITAVIDELTSSANEKNLTLQHSSQTEAEAMVDPKRFHQVLTNIVSNSIKYTKEGEIEIELDQKGKQLEIRVKDTGMGISAKDQKKLFAPFYRVESDDVSEITGTGLGMWITRQFIELMSGTIAVESIKGVGTHVVITVPKAEAVKSE